MTVEDVDEYDVIDVPSSSDEENGGDEEAGWENDAADEAEQELRQSRLCDFP